MAEEEKEQQGDLTPEIEKLLEGMDTDIRSIAEGEELTTMGAQPVSPPPVEEITPPSPPPQISAPQEVTPSIPVEPSPPQTISTPVTSAPEKPTVSAPAEIPGETLLEELFPSQKPEEKAAPVEAVSELIQPPEETAPSVEEIIPSVSAPEDVSAPPPPEEITTSAPVISHPAITPSAPVSAPVPSAPTPPPEEEKIELTPEQAQQVYMAIKKLPPKLAGIVSNIILNEELPPSDMNQLIKFLLSGAEPIVIKEFIEASTGKVIPEPVVTRPPIARKIGPSLSDVIKHDVMPILRLGILAAIVLYILIKLIIFPILRKSKAENLIEKGYNLILTRVPVNLIKAEKLFKEALSLRKKFYNAYLKYGEAYTKIKKYQKAEKKYLELIKLNPLLKEPYFKLSELYRKMGEFDEKWYYEAINIMQKYLKYQPDSIEALDKIARIYYYDLHQREKAKEVYTKLLEKDPKNIYAHYGLLSIYIFEGNLPEVEKEHLLILKYGKDKYIDEKRLVELARFYIDYKTDNPVKKDELYYRAEDTLKRVLKKYKHSAEAYYQYARLSRLRMDYNNAEYQIKQAIKFKPEEARYYNFLGELYLLRDRISLAIDMFRTAIEKDSNFAKAHYNLGNINYYILENYSEAIVNYENAYDTLYTNYLDLNYNLGWLYYTVKHDYLKSIEKWENAKLLLQKNFKENPVVDYAMGNAYLKLNKNELAISEYEDGVDYCIEKLGVYPTLSPENTEVKELLTLLSSIYNNLGVAYYNIGNEKQALYYFWKAIESAKKLGYSNENPAARINVQYVLKKPAGINSLQIIEDIPKTIVKEPFKRVPF